MNDWCVILLFRNPGCAEVFDNIISHAWKGLHNTPPVLWMKSGPASVG
jgi:hypothetical protein